MKHFACSLGQLNLIALRWINYNSRTEIEAITALCPLLKEVHFAVNRSPSTDDFLSPQQLRSLLSSPNSCWGNVFTVFFFYFPSLFADHIFG
jgi:hypothetical protein